jgi:hypothetical protein
MEWRLEFCWPSLSSVPKYADVHVNTIGAYNSHEEAIRIGEQSRLSQPSDPVQILAASRSHCSPFISMESAWLVLVTVPQITLVAAVPEVPQITL